jgi:hypothetical protein
MPRNSHLPLYLLTTTHDPTQTRKHSAGSFPSRILRTKNSGKAAMRNVKIEAERVCAALLAPIRNDFMVERSFYHRFCQQKKSWCRSSIVSERASYKRDETLLERRLRLPTNHSHHKNTHANFGRQQNWHTRCTWWIFSYFLIFSSILGFKTPFSLHFLVCFDICVYIEYLDTQHSLPLNCR